MTLVTPAPTNRKVGLDLLEGLVADLQAVRSHKAVLDASERALFAWAATVIEVREDEHYQKATDAVGQGSQLAVREVQAELAAALQISEYAVARKINLAHTLQERFPDTLTELGYGRIDGAHADIIAELGIDLTDEDMRAEYEQTALDWARTETPARLRGLLSDLITRLDPDGTENRVQDAVTRRRTTIRDLEPGLTRLQVDGPTAQIHGIHDRLTRIAADLHHENVAAAKEEAAAAAAAAARAAVGNDGSDGMAAGRAGRGPGAANGGTADTDATSMIDELLDTHPADDRTLTQIRADVAIDLLLTNGVTGHGTDNEHRARLADLRGVIHIELPATVLAGDTAGGALIPGAGPVDTHTARILAAHAPTWTRVFRDPATRIPTCVDTHRPSKKQRRLLRVRDVRCRFPGCRRPARGPVTNADIDHTIDWAHGGPTALHNLAHLCRRHHTLKHDTDWTVEQLPGGILRWITPTRRVHYDRPPSTVQFIDTEYDPHHPDDPTPPF
ncbi:HNH endonuclease signature motif containing protein [Microbacterium sp. ASV49]|uniref:DUF222 domain-containing protein n=1 Tax=Microbacterium candidum TaxID=3041922 RepID=A0ABT7N4A8_9MICO|nr:HNH endonuclease signature motif containing protein [Microbacterium sp. ASV49]MDL9981548.1 DUF222 domain-containing protein [Microbacterium sp. ASV49]